MPKPIEPIPEPFDARREIRCIYCNHYYKAKRLAVINSCVDKTYSMALFVAYSECPNCYALHGAEFSLS